MREERVGVISHYFTRLGVAAVQLEGELRVGDTIHIKGHTFDFTQKVESMQKDHRAIECAGRGDSVGIKIKEHGREHDIVYKVVEE